MDHPTRNGQDRREEARSIAVGQSRSPPMGETTRFRDPVAPENAEFVQYRIR